MLKRHDLISDSQWRVLNYDRAMRRYDYFLYKDYGETLEVGSGVGVFTIMLRQMGVKPITAVDHSEKCIETANAMLALNGVMDVPIIEGDVNELPFANRSFDTVVCLEVLEHLWTPHKALEEMARVTRNVGDLYVTCPRQGILPPSVTPGHHQDFSVSDLFGLLEDTGWFVYKQFIDEYFQYFCSRRKS